MTTLVSSPPIKYWGRTVDVLAFDGVQRGTESQVIQHLVFEGSNGALVTGIQKLAQRFLMELMTEIGSIPHLPERGCLFMTQARYGYWRTVADVRSAFYLGLFTVRTNLIREEDEDTPTDEQFDTAELVAVSLYQDQVSLRVKIISKAGTSLDVIYPIRTSVVSTMP